jgi:hypothetical protein
VTAHVADLPSQATTLRRSVPALVAAGSLRLAAGADRMVVKPTPLTSTASFLVLVPDVTSSTAAEWQTLSQIFAESCLCVRDTAHEITSDTLEHLKNARDESHHSGFRPAAASLTTFRTDDRSQRHRPRGRDRLRGAT